jgi:hypothetical protein
MHEPSKQDGQPWQGAKPESIITYRRRRLRATTLRAAGHRAHQIEGWTLRAAGHWAHQIEGWRQPTRRPRAVNAEEYDGCTSARLRGSRHRSPVVKAPSIPKHPSTHDDPAELPGSAPAAWARTHLLGSSSESSSTSASTTDGRTAG